MLVAGLSPSEGDGEAGAGEAGLGDGGDGGDGGLIWNCTGPGPGRISLIHAFRPSGASSPMLTVGNAKFGPLPFCIRAGSHTTTTITSVLAK